MNLLAIDSSGECCSVALCLDGEVVQRLEAVAPQHHSQRLLPMQQALMQAHGVAVSDLDLVACANGPGAFTGVRVAVALCQGLAYAADLPVLGVSSLAALGWGATRHYEMGEVLVATDARMGEVYWGHYARDGNGLRVVQADTLSRPEDVPYRDLSNGIRVGSGWSAYAQAFGQHWSADMPATRDYRLQAADIGTLAIHQLSMGQVHAIDAANLQAVYLRNQVTGQNQAQSTPVPDKAP